MVKGSRKSVSFGVVLTQLEQQPKQESNSIISETSSVDLIDGAKMSSSIKKRKPIIKKSVESKTAVEQQQNQEVPTVHTTHLLLGFDTLVVLCYFVHFSWHSIMLSITS